MFSGGDIDKKHGAVIGSICSEHRVADLINKILNQVFEGLFIIYF